MKTKACLLDTTTINDTYDVDIRLIVCRDQEAARVAWQQLSGNKDESGFGAMHAWTDHEFLMIFRYDCLCHCFIAHEVFHCVTRIMHYVGCKFDVDNHEHYAHLQGAIASWVYDQLRRAKLRVKYK